MTHSKDVLNPRQARGDEGFTLVEALIAIVILVFGMIAVTNLFLVAGSSNTVGNHSTVATAQAAEVMDRLRAIEFRALVAPNAGAGGGDTTPGNGALCVEPGATCVAPNVYEMTRTVPGVGTFTTSWRITPDPASAAGPIAAVGACPGVPGGFQVYAIVVHTESNSPLTRRRGAAELTTIRACTVDGCPGIRSCT